MPYLEERRVLVRPLWGEAKGLQVKVEELTLPC